MAINLQNANAYFKGRTIGGVWKQYSGDQKNTALLQAKRELSRELGRPMREDEPPYKEGDRRRDEYAVYEQALFDLVRDAMPEGDGEATPPLNADTNGQAQLVSVGGRWSRDALLWLADTLRANVIR